MKSLTCSNIDPSLDCHFTAQGESDDEVVGKMMQHAQEAHADKVKEMSEKMSMDEMKAMMKEKITS